MLGSFSFVKRKEVSQRALASPLLSCAISFSFSFFLFLFLSFSTSFLLFSFFFPFFLVYFHHDEFTYYATIIIAIPPIKQYLPHLPQTATTPSMTAALPYS